MMSGIRSRHTKPELVVRSGLHRRGFRFSLHKKGLKGTPDLVLPKHNAVIFVHGCFWHGHDCKFFRPPSSNRNFWKKKFERNQFTDITARRALADAGWRVAIVWECSFRGVQDKATARALDRIALWLTSDRKLLEVRGENSKR